MDDLDRLITDHVVRELLTPERMRSLLEVLQKRQFASADRSDETLATMREKRDKADLRLRRLLEAVANGGIPPDDPSLKKMTSEAAGERDLAQTCIDRAEAETAPKARITDASSDAFLDLMRKNIADGTIEFRRAYLRAIIREVQILPTEIRIIGHGDEIEHQLAA